MALDNTSFKKIIAAVLPHVEKIRQEEIINQIADVFVDDSGATVAQLQALTWNNVSQFGEGVPNKTDIDAILTKYNSGTRLGHGVPST